MASEEERIDELDRKSDCLLDFVLQFERQFGEMAIDRCDLSDDECEELAAHLSRPRRDGADLGQLFALLLRRVKHERAARVVGHMVRAVWAHEGHEQGINVADLRARYDRIPKGNS